MMDLTDDELAKVLKEAAEAVMKADGDRDYMNPSDLTVQVTTSCANLMMLAAERLAA